MYTGLIFLSMTNAILRQRKDSNDFTVLLVSNLMLLIYDENEFDLDEEDFLVDKSLIT